MHLGIVTNRLNIHWQGKYVIFWLHGSFFLHPKSNFHIHIWPLPHARQPAWSTHSVLRLFWTQNGRRQMFYVPSITHNICSKLAIAYINYSYLSAVYIYQALHRPCSCYGNSYGYCSCMSVILGVGDCGGRGRLRCILLQNLIAAVYIQHSMQQFNISFVVKLILTLTLYWFHKEDFYTPRQLFSSV